MPELCSLFEKDNRYIAPIITDSRPMKIEFRKIIKYSVEIHYGGSVKEFWWISIRLMRLIVQQEWSRLQGNFGVCRCGSCYNNASIYV